MTLHEAGRPAHGTAVPQPGPDPETLVARPMPRLGRGIVWSLVTAEIERDHALRTESDAMRDAA
ncbi:hypothetical protein DMA12_31660 [Amycolatopsis balhimycina DSM 5908]|uniref:Uncharacterized protein n=1 Tax=Amycolatopsis balhimycina DSM 5908 TaxID=1081091 RepID=A0A428W725_AMYBA|nr:DUF6222 family protein [Amycolatopsis balhimycina]RSM38833.1 hypothetical protein DMA12_31660 [Amycolatopsis balhimycina DSM 5908]